MNLALIGYGRMGQGIVKLLDESINVKLIVDPVADKNIIDKNIDFYKKTEEVPDKLINNIDVFVVFVTPDAAFDICSMIMKRKNNAKIISGTTAWNADNIKDLVKETNALFLHSPNFSIGINVMAYALALFAQKLGALEGFEASMVEYHHKHKLDQPSGTAKMLAGVVEKNSMDCPVSCVRVGTYPGTHTVAFDALTENIEITHTARSRDVFCSGVIEASKWLYKQSKPDFYTFNNIIEGGLNQ